MSRAIVSHEEVLAAIVSDLHGAAIVAEVADVLAVSTSTARRHCEDMVSRGWLSRSRGFGLSGRIGAVEYDVTPRGQQVHENGERW